MTKPVLIHIYTFSVTPEPYVSLMLSRARRMAMGFFLSLWASNIPFLELIAWFLLELRCGS